MNKGSYFISGNINQIECIIDSLQHAVKVAKLAEELEKEGYTDGEKPEIHIEMRNKEYYQDEDATIEYDMKIKY